MRKGNNVKIENKDGEIFRREKNVPQNGWSQSAWSKLDAGGGGLKLES